MKNLIAVKKALIKDIIFTMLLVVISIPIWLNFDVTALETARMYDNYNYIGYEFLNKPSYSLKPVCDDYAMRFYETQDLIVYNDTIFDEKYALVLKINKNSTANTNNLKLNVNYQISYLEELPSYEDEDNYYYVIDTNNIVASSQKYVMSIWNDENAQVNDSDYLNYEFMVM